MGGVAWSEEEDHLLRKCIEQYGEGKWHRIPLLAGINRCRKSCRLRWLNYLRPNIKRGKFTDEEVELIIKLHKLLGNRWSLIAGRLPGRTANDVKNYWHCHLNKRLNSHMGKSNAITCNTKTTEEKIIIMESSRNEATKDEFHAQVHDNNVASVSNNNNKEIIPCVFQGNSYEDSNNVINQQKEVKIISCEESMAIEEFPMDIDFDLEEIKISGSDHRKYNNWDFDDLLFNMEI